MINSIQSSLRPLLWVVLLIIAIPFVFYTTGPSLLDRSGGQANLGKIDGTAITQEQFRDAQSSVYTMLMLHYGDQIPETADFRRQIQNEVWQRLLVLSSAKKWGVVVTDKQIDNFLQFKMPGLQADGQFKPELFTRLLEILKQKYNVSDIRFREIMRDQLTVEEMENIITSPIHVEPSEVTAQFESIYGAATVSVVTLPLKNYLSQVTVTDQEIDQAYQAQSQSNPAYRTKERRRVSYVLFPLTAEQQKLPDAEKQEVRRKIGDTALNFALSLEPEPDATNPKPIDFAQTAKKSGLTAASTSLFTVDEAPAPLPPSPSFNRAAFALTNERPISSAIETPAGFYVLKLDEIAASKPLDLKDVKTQIEDQIKNTRAFALLQKEGSTDAEKIKAEVAKGTPFRVAATQLKLNVETLPAFVPGDPKLGNDSKLALIRRLAMIIKPGQVSDFIPTESGGMIGSVDSRQPADRKTYGDMEAQIEAKMLSNARSVAFQEWIRNRSVSAGTALPQTAAGVQQSE